MFQSVQEEVWSFQSQYGIFNRIIPDNLPVDVISSINYEYLESSGKIKYSLTNENIFAGRYIISNLKASEALGTSGRTMKAPI